MDEDDVPESYRPPRHWSRRARLISVALWCSFLGAVFNTLLLLVLSSHGPIGAELGTLTLWFVLAWVIGVVPVSFAIVLLAPPPSEE